MIDGEKTLIKELKKSFKGFKVKPKETTAEWIEDNVYVPSIVGSPYPGRISLDNNPWMKGFFEFFDNPTIRQITLMKSARVGGSMAAILSVIATIGRNPNPILWVGPTEGFVSRFVGSELQPILTECPVIKEKALLKRETWTRSMMQFRDCILRCSAAASPNQIAGFNACVIVCDELDKWGDNESKNEAPPLELVRVRAKNFQYSSKLLVNSTPTVESGNTYQQFIHGTQSHYYLPCLHCNKYQRLTFFKEEAIVPFDEDLNYYTDGQTRTENTGEIYFNNCKDEELGIYDYERVANETCYKCSCCNTLIEYKHLAYMMQKGKWMHHNPQALNKGHVSMHISSLYSLMEGWGSVAKAYLDARGAAGKMQNFYNSYLGKVWVRESKQIKESDIDKVIERSPDYVLGQIPYKPLLITMGVDVQQTEMWFTIAAHGILYNTQELPTWTALIDYGSIVNLSQIDDMLSKPFYYENEEYYILGGFIDGGFGQQRGAKVYEFVAQHPTFSVVFGRQDYQLRGRTLVNSQIATTYHGDIDGWLFNDDIYKQQLYYDCIRGERHWYLPRDIGNDFKEQLTDEYTKPVKQPNGSTKLVWHSRRNNNHLGDCMKFQRIILDIPDVVSRFEEERQSILNNIEQTKAA